MRRKTKRFNGFGFPVVLVGVPVRVEFGDEILDVDFNALGNRVFAALLTKPGRLSGAEVKFLRQSLDMTQEQFAKIMKVERSLISKWEKQDLKAKGMSSHIEIFLRLKLAKMRDQNIDRDFDVIEPAAATGGVGKPLELKMNRAG
jgi:DNA-binding XRE family transcriptional regulator